MDYSPAGREEATLSTYNMAAVRWKLPVGSTRVKGPAAERHAGGIKLSEETVVPIQQRELVAFKGKVLLLFVITQ